MQVQLQAHHHHHLHLLLSPKPLSLSFSSPSSIFSKTTRPPTRLQISASAATFSSTASATTMYDLLSVTETADLNEIKSAFRKMARELHPDTCQSDNKEYCTQQFIKAREAYRVLSDPVLREDYDYNLKNRINGVLLRKNGIREASFGDWESQLEGLMRRSYRRATSSSWGQRMRATAAASTN